jgi:hypothetical protein
METHKQLQKVNRLGVACAESAQWKRLWCSGTAIAPALFGYGVRETVLHMKGGVRRRAPRRSASNDPTANGPRGCVRMAYDLADRRSTRVEPEPEPS